MRQRLTLDYAVPDAHTLLPAIAQNMSALRDSLGPLSARLVGVGVAAPFQMGGWHKMLGLSEAQSTEWNQIDLAAQVQAMTEAPVNFVKDTSAACMAELVTGRGRDLKSFLYLFVDTFVGGGLVINSHLHLGVHGNAGAVASLPSSLADGTAAPAQLLSHASLWELEQRFIAHDLDPSAAYDERAMSAPFEPETSAWVATAANALAHCVVSGTAFLDIEAVVIDGSFCRPLLNRVIALTNEALQRYNWEGLWPATVIAGNVGPDAGALGGGLLPLHANFAPDQDVFLKVGA